MKGFVLDLPEAKILGALYFRRVCNAPPPPPRLVPV